MRIKKFRYFVSDFETTVYEGQEFTEVWASASVELFTEDVQIFHSIDDQFNYFKSQDCNLIVYYHNLKFDGTFWIDFLIRKLHFEQAFYVDSESDKDFALGHFYKDNKMKNNTFKYSISDRGQWYTIIIKVNNHYIELRDSLKLLPFSVKRIGESFKTKHKKLEMEYEGFRYAGCEITDKEKEYIANDILVVKEALEIMFQEGHTQLTIGSCCLAEYKKLIGGKDYFDSLFPNIYDITLDKDEYGSPTVGDYIRRSYKGGWCYLVKGKENKIYNNGITADVNSLYPSMMSKESGNLYPIGLPKFWQGNYIPDEAIAPDKYFFIRIKTRFYIKKNKLPFIQIKGSLLYRGTEALESSDIVNKEGKTSPYYIDIYGNKHDTRQTLTLTMTDYYLFLEHYDTVEFEILDGCYFNAICGIFEGYIEKYKQIKLTSKGAMRELAKLFLNNLYGKMATNRDSSFKVAYLKEDNSIGFYPVTENEKKPGYIPVGSAITSYARNFTIRAAQKNYYGKNKPGFIYADTDSIHCDLPADKLKGITVHDKNFCCWKLESSWDVAYFTRQKTYIEHVVAENLEPIETPYYNIKCAGMPPKSKNFFLKSMEGVDPDNLSEEDRKFLNIKGELKKEEYEFLRTKRTLEDFKIGLVVPGKLIPKRIPGGTVLVETTYEMR